MKSIFLFASLLLPCVANAQEETGSNDDVLLENEISMGIGAAFPGEKDPLNVPGEPSIPTSFGLNLGYRHFFDEHISLGVRMYGYFDKLKDYYVTSSSSSTPARADFDFSAINLSVEGMMLFGERPTQPYVFLVVGYSAGSLQHDEFGSLAMNGISGGGGAGIRVAVSTTVAIFLEGIGSFGAGTWKKQPFSNSSGDKFNPAVFMILAGVDIAWK